MLGKSLRVHGLYSFAYAVLGQIAEYMDLMDLKSGALTATLDDLCVPTTGTDECPPGQCAEHIKKAPWARAREGRWLKTDLLRMLVTRTPVRKPMLRPRTYEHPGGQHSGCMR
jgi:hypothetical protein